MTKTSKTILFFGNERIATGVEARFSALQALIGGGYQVAAVVVAQSDISPSRQPRPLEVADIAEKHGIPLLNPGDLSAAQAELAAFGAEAGVLVAYGQLVPQSLLDIFPTGIVNLHPSLLPLHRGPTPIESAILNGDSQTGISLMRLGAEMDNGPVYDQAVLPLKGNETKQALADHLLNLGGELLIKNLPAILDGSLQPRPQDDSKATYDKKIDKADGVLDWNKPALQLEREIRAFAGWPRSRTKLGNTDVIVTGAQVEDSRGELGKITTDKGLAIQTSDGLLVIDSLIPDGKKEMSAAAFLAGYQL